MIWFNDFIKQHSMMSVIPFDTLTIDPFGFTSGVSLFIALLFAALLFIAIRCVCSHQLAVEHEMTKLAFALDALNAHVAILDQTGDVQFVNKAWKDFATANGYATPDFGVGCNYVGVCKRATGENASEASDAVHGILSVLDGTLDRFELEYPCHREIEQRWFRMQVTRFTIRDRTYAVVSHENLTLQKLTEIRLQQKESKLRSILEGGSEAIILLNENGFIDCNQNALSLLGVKSKLELCDAHPADFAPAIQPCGRESRDLANEIIQIAFETGRIEFEWLHHRPDGSQFPAEVILTAFGTGDNRILQACVRDISKRKESEFQLKSLTEELRNDLAARHEAERQLRETTRYLDVYRTIVDSHAIVAEGNTSGTLIQVNDALCEITGFTRNELVGQNYLVLASCTSDRNKWHQLLKHIAAGKTWHGELCNKRKDGSNYWVDTTVAPLFADSGKIRGYFAICVDITELKNAQSKAIAANQTKSEFLANMSHEIRTPMTAILGYADLLEEAISNSSRCEENISLISTIRRNGNYLLAIINDILDISKIEADKVEIEEIEIDLTVYLDEIMDLMRVKVCRKPISFELELAPNTPRKILSDPTRLRQILVNLLGNAIKFTESGSVRLIVTRDMSNENQILFLVRDTGIGMTSLQMSRIFMAFEQGDSSTTRKFGGSGLGLLISQRLTELLGGKIEVESQIGFGSTFKVMLPQPNIVSRDLSNPSSPNSELPRSIPDSPISKQLRNCHILLIEDGIDNQKLITYFLSKEGAVVDVFENGRLALEHLTIDGTTSGELPPILSYDLILTDMQMPEMDGYSTASQLKEKGCEVPIIALTAHAMAGDRERCLASGCCHHLSKPIDRIHLIQTCATWIESYRNRIDRFSLSSSPSPNSSVVFDKAIKN